MSNMKENNDERETTAGQKKPYRCPRLAVYGSLHDLTAGGAGTRSDAGGLKTKSGSEK